MTEIKPKQIKALYAGGVEEKVAIRNYPDECPLCHNAISPMFVAAALNRAEQVLQIVYRCTRGECQQLFIATHDRNKVGTEYFFCTKTAPTIPKKKEFSNEIEETSEMFITIYNQALEAENTALDQLAGMGFRKALEFLVKDYAIATNPDKEEEIKGMFLSSCIKTYLDDENLKACAERAVWLGNDEAHYIRKWEDKDIDDLKTLIRLTINWIESVLLTKKYIDEMPDS